MDLPMTEEESFAERRQLFKDIWDTSMNIENTIDIRKERNGLNKPRVIKTARLDEVNRCVIDKKKKQRIKNLRIVCNKLLEFCDNQDAEDRFYEEMAKKGKGKSKPRVRKAKKAKRMFTQDLKIDKSSTISSPSKIIGKSQGSRENYRKRTKSHRINKFPDEKYLIRALQNESNKRLFPINKILIAYLRDFNTYSFLYETMRKYLLRQQIKRPVGLF